MTNRERAKKLLGYQIDIAGSQAAKDQPLIEAIEQALDEAEKRGEEKWKALAGELLKALEYCAIEPELLHPENNRQCIVAGYAIAKARKARNM